MVSTERALVVERDAGVADDARPHPGGRIAGVYRRSKTPLALLFCAVAAAAGAQAPKPPAPLVNDPNPATVAKAEVKSAAMEAQPLTHLRDGRVHGCGLRLTGGEPRAPASSWFDVSFNVFRRGFGLAQSIAYEFRRSDLAGDSRPARVPLQSTWVRGTEGSVRRGENLERRDSLIYRLATEEVLALFETVAAGEPVTLGIKRWDENADAIYIGTPSMTSSSREQISTCLAQLTD